MTQGSWELGVYHLRLAMESALAEPGKGYVPVASSIAELVLEHLMQPDMRGPFESLFEKEKKKP